VQLTTRSGRSRSISSLKPFQSAGDFSRCRRLLTFQVMYLRGGGAAAAVVVAFEVGEAAAQGAGRFLLPPPPLPSWLGEEEEEEEPVTEKKRFICLRKGVGEGCV
jgi:hypothetical protein